MSVNTLRLKKERVFEDEKIKISFSIGSVSNSFSVYIKDENGKNYHVLWEISPDRCHQNFDKTNEKIKTFILNKIDEWVADDEEAERLRKESIQKREHNEENKINRIMDSF